jgi:hypothetical protein
MSKFGGNKGRSRFGGNGGGSGNNSGGNGGGQNRRSGGGYGGNRGGSGGGNGGQKEYAFLRLGDLTVAKSTVEEQGQEIVENLKDSNARLWLKIYLPKGTNEITLQNGDRVMVTLQKVPKAPDFVVGRASIPNNTNDEN